MMKDEWKKKLRDLSSQAKAYWTKAVEHLDKMGTEWELVECDTDEYHAWVRYFRRQGFKPHMLTMVERRVIDKIAVPAKLPEWFHVGYVDDGKVPPFPIHTTSVKPLPVPVEPGKVNWSQYLKGVDSGDLQRPVIGRRFAASGEISKRSYTENEQEELLEKAKATAKELGSKKLSAATMALLHKQDSYYLDANGDPW